MKLLTQKEYARRKRVTPQYVNKLVREGKIVLRDKLVDPRQADAALKAWARPGAKKSAKRKAAAKKGGQASAKKRRATGKAVPKTAKRGTRGNATDSLTGWRAKNEEMKAKLAELELKKATAELLPRQEVLEAERWKNANIRTRFRKLARSLAPRLARIVSASEAESVLLEEIDLQLADLAADPLGIESKAEVADVALPAMTLSAETTAVTQ